MSYRVVVTDYAWRTLSIERNLLREVDAVVVEADSADERVFGDLIVGADAILTNWARVPSAALELAERCLVISRYGIGLDNIPVEQATDLGILVVNVPDFCTDEVSDHTLALVLACARRVVHFDRATSAGAWDLLQGARGIHRLRGQTLGILGYGRLGRAVAMKAGAFGLKVLVYTPRLTSEDVGPEASRAENMAQLLQESDYVCLHAPATSETKGMIDRDALRLMKPTAFLVNTARGVLVDEDALYSALRENRIAGAALDVLSVEPADSGHPLLKLENVIVTPHAAFYSEESIAELQYRAASSVAQVLRGEVPSSLVNPGVLDQPNCRLREHRLSLGGTVDREPR